MPPLKPLRFTIRLPAEIVPLIDKRVKEELYHSMTAYFVGLAIWDCYFRNAHKLTGALMKEPHWIIDEVIAELVADFDKIPEDKRHGGWIEKRILALLKKKRDTKKRRKSAE